MTGSCEFGNESSISTKAGNILTSWDTSPSQERL